MGKTRNHNRTRRRALLPGAHLHPCSWNQTVPNQWVLLCPYGPHKLCCDHAVRVLYRAVNALRVLAYLYPGVAVVSLRTPHASRFFRSFRWSTLAEPKLAPSRSLRLGRAIHGGFSEVILKGGVWPRLSGAAFHTSARRCSFVRQMQTQSARCNLHEPTLTGRPWILWNFYPNFI
jgi:hypothetical protein